MEVWAELVQFGRELNSIFSRFSSETNSASSSPLSGPTVFDAPAPLQQSEPERGPSDQRDLQHLFFMTIGPLP